MTQFGLNKNEVINICSVLKNFNELDEAFVFGSRARGNYKPGSDIDLALKGRDLNLSVLNKITQQLDYLNLPYIFDLCIYERITNPDLIHHIKRVGVLFYENDPRLQSIP